MAESSKISTEQGKRLYQALTASGDELFQVLLDPDIQVLRSTLKNQNLNEDHLLALLKRRDLTEDFLKAIYQLDISKASHRLQVALVKNPGTPGPVADLLKIVMQGGQVNFSVRRSAQSHAVNLPKQLKKNFYHVLIRPVKG